MADDPHREVTMLLDDIRAGRADAQTELVALVYDELRQVAAGLRPGRCRP